MVLPSMEVTMKYLVVISCLFSLPALANSEQLSCKSANGDVEFTREWLVIKSTDKQGLFDTIEPFQSEDNNSDPREGDVLQFKSSYAGQAGVKLSVKKVGKSEKVAGEEN